MAAPLPRTRPTLVRIGVSMTLGMLAMPAMATAGPTMRDQRIADQPCGDAELPQGAAPDLPIRTLGGQDGVQPLASPFPARIPPAPRPPGPVMRPDDTPRGARPVPAIIGPDRLARTDGEAQARPLRITLTSHLDFSRLAVGGRGVAVIDPVTDRREVSGAVTDLGGMALSGAVEVSGEPGRAVMVTLPRQVRLIAPGRPPLIVDRLVTDLPAMPVLGEDGRLVFRFGGQLVLDGQDAAQGAYRGRVAISVDYQ